MGVRDLFRDIFTNDTNTVIDPPSIMDINGSDLQDKKSVENPSIPFSTPRMYTYNPYPTWPRRVQFYSSEYDLPTIANSIQLDGLLNRCVNIFVEQVLKNGFEMVSLNDKAQKHVRSRIKEIELLTGVKFEETLTQIARQLVSYGNCYIIKVRKANLSKVGKRYKLFGKQKQPIVGLFVADASTIDVGVNYDNQITHYRQMVQGQYRIFRSDDVIHLSYNRIPGTLTGQTPINQVLDDVRALRKLEEEIEILGFQYAIPLYVYKVGTDQHPAQPGEVDTAAAKVNNMPTAGLLVVPHTHDIESVTNQNDPVDIMKFVDHFKKRVYAGLGISPIAMGEVETSNRNTAEILDLTMQTITKSYQQVITNKMEQELIHEFLLDGGINVNNVEVEFRFPEIDLEATIKKETHILQKYQGNIITLEEARMEMDMDTRIKEDDLYLNNVQIPLIQAEGEVQANLQETQAKSQEKIARMNIAAKPTTTSSSSKKTGTSKKKAGTKAKSTAKASQKSTTSKSQPSNQHGKQLSRPKIKKDSLQELSDYCKGYGEFLFNDSGYKSAISRSKFLDNVSDKIKDSIKEYMNEAIAFYSEYYHSDKISLSNSMLEDIHTYLIKKVTDSVSRIGVIDGENTNTKVYYCLSSIADSVTQEDKLNNLAKILVLKNSGAETILLNSEECDLHSDWEYSTDDISFDKVPPLRYKCGCFIEEPNYADDSECEEVCGDTGLPGCSSQCDPSELC